MCDITEIEELELQRKAMDEIYRQEEDELEELYERDVEAWYTREETRREEDGTNKRNMEEA